MDHGRMGHGHHGMDHTAVAKQPQPAGPAHCGDGGCAYSKAVQPTGPSVGAVSGDLPLQPVALPAAWHPVPVAERPTTGRFTEYRSPPLPNSPVLEHRVLRI